MIAKVAAVRLETGKPARNRDITATNWVGVDIDDDPIEGELTTFGKLQEAELEPTVIVETSPGRFQALWRVDRHLSPDKAAGINKALAKRFRGDPKSTNPARLFRVPGYLHRKQKLHAVRSQIVGGTAYGYSTAALAKWSGVKRAGQERGKQTHGGTSSLYRMQLEPITKPSPKANRRGSKTNAAPTPKSAQPTGQRRP